MIRRFQDEGKTRFVGLSDWSSEKIMDFIVRCDPDVVQPLRNVMDDTYESSGLKNYIETHNLGICFFSPLKHGLLTGKYKQPAVFLEGDHRARVKEFQNSQLLEKMLSNKTLLEKNILTTLTQYFMYLLILCYSMFLLAAPCWGKEMCCRFKLLPP